MNTTPRKMNRRVLIKLLVAYNDRRNKAYKSPTVGRVIAEQMRIRGN